MNPGTWKVTWQYIGGVKMYAVYRLRDINEVDHSGNREYATGYSENREGMQETADQMNSYIDNAEDIRSI